MSQLADSRLAFFTSYCIESVVQLHRTQVLRYVSFEWKQARERERERRWAKMKRKLFIFNYFIICAMCDSVAHGVRNPHWFIGSWSVRASNLSGGVLCAPFCFSLNALCHSKIIFYETKNGIVKEHNFIFIWTDISRQPLLDTHTQTHQPRHDVVSVKFNKVFVLAKRFHLTCRFCCSTESSNTNDSDDEEIGAQARARSRIQRQRRRAE